jgi:hypothetical protein
MKQLKRFEAAGLPIPNPPSNGGQCVVDTTGSGPIPGQPGSSGTYRLYEIQRWVVSATPKNPGQIQLLYPFKWTTIGNGERHEDNGVGTRNDWTFTISGSGGAELAATKIASTGNWGIGVPAASFPGGVVVTQQQTITGSPPRAPGTTKAVASSVPLNIIYGSMTVAFPPQGSPPGTLSYMPATPASKQVPNQIVWGYPQPGYARGTIACTWTLAVGP